MPDPLVVHIHNRFKENSGHKLKVNDVDEISPQGKKKYNLDENRSITVKVHTTGGDVRDCYVTLPKSADLGIESHGKVRMTLSYLEEEDVHFFKVHREHPLHWELRVSKKGDGPPVAEPEENVSIGDDPPGINL